VIVGRLTAEHVNEFGAIKHLCYRGLDSATLRERVGDRLSRHLGLASYCFGATDPSTALPVHSVSVGLDPSVMEVFYGLVLATPSLDFGPWISRPQRVARLDDLVDDVDGDPYMTEILRPSGLRYDVQMACVGSGWSWGHMCLRRQERAGEFAPHELRFLEALAPHLTAGLRAASSRAALSATAATTTGIVVLGPDGRVELANGVAEQLFRQPVSGTRHSFLSAVNIVAARLQSTLDDDGRTAVPQLTILDESSQRTYRLRAERLLGTDGRPRGLVVIEPAGAPGASELIETLARHGLTRRECEVAAALLRGRSTAEIAGELAVSPHTVADYVRNVLDKVGVGSRQQLATRLLGSG
jgi:DNA-binding CsgD family transcriptional regulator